MCYVEFVFVDSLIQINHCERFWVIQRRKPVSFISLTMII